MPKQLIFSKRWQDCPVFVDALIKRGYLTLDDDNNTKTLMSDGIYLYMYELFQDGYRAGSVSTPA